MSDLQARLPGLISAVYTADKGSFTTAAKVLKVSPAAVSKNVAVLEAMLGFRVFNRTTRRLSLTEEGKVLVLQAHSGLNQLELASVQANAAQGPRGVVRVNAPVGFGRRYVLPLLPGLYAKYPEIQVDLCLSDQAGPCGRRL
jgi:DNA-binding transcriptional LysR family regulator